MNNNQEEIIQKAIKYIEELFQDEHTGHDVGHTLRVFKMAQTICEKEQGNLFIVSLAALLHDVDDRKIFEDTSISKSHAKKFLNEEKVDQKDVNQILTIINEVSFKGKDTVKPTTLEGEIVQDADRLDALGAIGIARCFTYGGAKGRVLYDSAILPKINLTEEEYFHHESTTINHFYEKLLLLKDLMNTKTAYEIAVHHHEVLEKYLKEFFDEWEGIK